MSTKNLEYEGLYYSFFKQYKNTLKTNEEKLKSHKEYFRHKALLLLYSSMTSASANRYIDNRYSLGIDLDMANVIEALTILKIIEDDSFNDEAFTKAYNDKSLLSLFVNVDTLESYIDKYQVLGEDTLRMYQMFKSMTLPRYDDDDDYELDVYSLRGRFMKHIFDYMNDYLKDNNLFVDQGDVHIDALLDNDVFNQTKDNMNIYLKEKKDSLVYDVFYTDDYEEVSNLLNKEFINRIRDLTLDLYVCYTIGLSEEIIRKFKMFMDYGIVARQINKIKKVKTWQAYVNTFALFSRVRLAKYFDKDAYCLRQLPTAAKLQSAYRKVSKDVGLSFKEFSINMETNPVCLVDIDFNDENLIWINKSLKPLSFGNKMLASVVDIYKLSKQLNTFGGFAKSDENTARMGLSLMYKWTHEYFKASLKALDMYEEYDDFDEYYFIPNFQAKEIFLNLSKDVLKK